MYQVLIVDDERIIREGLAKHFPWKQYEMQVAAVMANADQALAHMRHHAVDVLVTDIKMPEKSGFDLIRELTGLNKLPQVILVSSYNEFAYAQQACMLDMVCDYILKPIDFATFGQALERASHRLQKQEKLRISFDTREYMNLLGLIDRIQFDQEKFTRELIDHDKTLAPKTWQKTADILQESACSLDTLIRFCSNLLLHIESQFQNQLSGAYPHLRNMHEMQERLFASPDKKTLFQIMEQQITSICNHSQEQPVACKSHLVASAISMVRKKHTNVDFNLSSLATELNVTPNYLSMKFREETGTAFTKYLTDWRISKAKNLLSDAKRRVSEVAQLVGFSDEKYFIRVFKAELGITPKKYQQTLLHK